MTIADMAIIAGLVFAWGAVSARLERLDMTAVASLTVIRMLPVVIALTGSRLGRPAALFMGWFGPRGLASVVFALLALEDLEQSTAQPASTRGLCRAPAGTCTAGLDQLPR